MTHEAHFRKLERMYAGAPVNAWFAPRLTVGEGTAQVVIPVRREFFHAAGALHGALQSSSPQLRIEAAAALLRVGASPDDVGTHLMGLLLEGDEEVRDQVWEALARTGARASSGSRPKVGRSRWS